jgi:radical SAM protein with 4Fe4S-binding SPASM domain
METGSEEYFFLEGDCLLVTGARNAAIYQLSSGDVYAIDSVGRKILELTEQGTPISSVYPRIEKVPQKTEIADYLQRLETLRLGRFSPKPVLPPKTEIQPASFILKKVWLELTNRCNLRCVHCYADSSPRRDNGSLSLKQWQAVISEAARLGARWIQFIGGEPLLYGKRNLFKLIARAREAHYDVVEIFTNGTLLDDEYVSYFAEHRIRVALSVYSRRPEIHDKVTQSPGSFQRMIKNAEKLQERGVPSRFGLVVMNQNCQYEEETLEWLRTRFGDSYARSDVVRSTPGSRDQPMALLTPDLWKRRLRTSPVFPKATLEDFVRSKLGHSCLSGEICVQPNGMVYPCIMDRTHVLGSIAKSTLREVVEGAETQTIWGLSKDHICVCRDCEYRYACFDCRPLAVAVAEAMEQPQRGLFAKDPCCLYDPYKGEWGNVDEFMNKLVAKGLLEANRQTTKPKGGLTNVGNSQSHA